VPVEGVRDRENRFLAWLVGDHGMTGFFPGQDAAVEVVDLLESEFFPECKRA
jgi:hypothetical protein